MVEDKTITSAVNDIQSILVHYRKNIREFIEDTFYIIPREKRLGPVPFRFNTVQDYYWKSRAQNMVIAKARRVTISAIVEAEFTANAILRPSFHALQVLQKPFEKTSLDHVRRVEAFIAAAQKRFRYGSSPEDTWPRLTIDNTEHKEFDFGESEHGARMISSITFVGSGSKDVIQGSEYDYYHITEVPSYEPDEIDALNRGLLGSPYATVRYESRPERAGDVFHQLYLAAKTGESSYRPLFIPWHWADEHAKRADDLWENADPALAYDSFPLEADEQQMMETDGLSWDQIRFWRFALADANGNKEVRASQLARDDESCWNLAGNPVVSMENMESLVGSIAKPIEKNRYGSISDYNGMLKLWLLPQKAEAYAIYADPAEGYSTSHDTAIVIRRARDWAYVGEIRGKISPEDTGRILVELGRHFNNALLGWEREPRSAGIRAIVIGIHKYPNVYSFREKKWGHPDKEPGLPVTQWTKSGLISDLVDFMDTGAYSTPSESLVAQYAQLQKTTTINSRDDKERNTYNTAKLDMVMADVGCFQLREQSLRMLRNLQPQKKVEALLPRYLRGRG